MSCARHARHGRLVCHPRPVRPVRVRLVLGATALLLALAGCGGARNTLGTSASVCFKALPGAIDATHKQGRLVGVRRIKASVLQSRLPEDHQLASVPPGDELCVFAFKGDYHPGEVTGAPPAASGPYAVIALTIRRPKEVAAFVLQRLPTRFAHNQV